MWVFPGGQVDPVDLRPSSEDRAAEEVELDAARRAAVREAREEAGLVLDEATWSRCRSGCHLPSAPRRFATWFFLAPRCPSPGVAIEVDRSRSTSTVG